MSEQRADYSAEDNQPRDKHGNTIGIGDTLVARREDSEALRFKVVGVDTLQGSGSVQVECLGTVEPGFEKRWISRYDLWQGYEIETKATHEYPASFDIDEYEQQRARDRDYNEREQREAMRDTQGGMDVDDTEEPYEESLPEPRFEETGDYSENVRQTRMEFPHFQEDQGKKRVTIFALEVTSDMRRTIEVQFGELGTHLSAHDALRLLNMLDAHRTEITALSNQLDAAALSDDMRDMHRIREEWEQYKHTDARGLGDETPSKASDL